MIPPGHLKDRVDQLSRSAQCESHQTSRVPTALVVDDDSFMRAALRRVCAGVGIRVETYASALELLATADLRAPAVLVLDVMMPGMSGLELQTLLLERGVNLPVIFLTGSANIPMVVTAMRNGAVDFLEKPFDNAVLVERIRTALTRRTAPNMPARDPPADHARRLAVLTPREREVFDCMIAGKTNKMIARELGRSCRTIEVHRARVMNKMGAGNLAVLVRRSFEAVAVA